ncbi:unnamed protein product [Protopolystoma xenopodis]|uniref:Vacuolar protein-sorting-associated protein 36 n=1 Tax=Protopolystoma xenopodis TaxID=117903 RepID=A0A3S4ZZT4_9PLAT|nr:unnamed protein product [Protopolystoma xenopodis]
MLSSAALQNAITLLPQPQPAWILDFSDPLSVNSVVGTGTINQNASAGSIDFLRLGFTQAGHKNFERALTSTLSAKCWSVTRASVTQSNFAHSSTSSVGALGGGIGAIERQRAQRTEQADRSIGEAFSDLDNLMNRAGEMVRLSRDLAEKLKQIKVGR